MGPIRRAVADHYVRPSGANGDLLLITTAVQPPKWTRGNILDQSDDVLVLIARLNGNGRQHQRHSPRYGPDKKFPVAFADDRR
jgi:hypothetical protein